MSDTQIKRVVPRVYIASPLGFSPTTAGYYNDVLLVAVRDAGLESLDPWADPIAPQEFAAAQALAPSERRAAFRAVNRRLGEANEAMIRRADGMLAVLDGTDVDSGTAAEIGFAAAMRKPIVGVRLDVRQTGDNEGSVVNLQVEHFIIVSSGEILDSLPDAVELLVRLVSASSPS